jgi:uncharacterized membrane protein
MVVLFAGVAALLKYAADEGWLSAPIELRLGAVALAAMAGLAFGFRQRLQRPAFSLALQGGAIGVLVLTVFVSYRIYGLLPSGLTFALLVLLVAGSGALAVVQDARSLGVLATLAGFLAPVLASSGTGSHVALFSWYAILNLLVLGVAFWKSWRILDWLGFLFTSTATVAWGATGHTPEHLLSSQAFATLFFLIYLALPILHTRAKAPPKTALSSTLIFGNPIVFLGMQAVFLFDRPLALAFVALAAAATYVGLATRLRGRVGAGLLFDAFAALALCFATLAIPLALSARATAGVFAMEGAALVWLGLRQGRPLSRYAGIALQVVAGLTFLGTSSIYGTALRNGRLWSGLWVVAGAVASAWAARASGRRVLAGALFAWSLVAWALVWAGEITEFVPSGLRAAAFLTWAGVTAWLLAEVYRATAERALAWLTGLWMLLAVGFAFAQVQTPPFAGWGALAWAAFAMAGVRALQGLRAADPGPLALTHLAWWVALATALGGASGHLARALGMGSGWAVALGAIAPLCLFGLTLRRPAWIALPLGERFGSYRTIALWGQSALLALAFLWLLGVDGSATPLPFLPLFNPLALATCAWLVLSWTWIRHGSDRWSLCWGVAVFLAVSVETFRSVHWLGGSPWDGALLARMELQASLSVAWSVLGVVACVLGSRSCSRPAWFAGAALLSVVLLKLAIVDRAHLGSLAGIVSFLAFGVLCTLVGYLAPVPPRGETRLSA